MHIEKLEVAPEDSIQRNDLGNKRIRAPLSRISYHFVDDRHLQLVGTVAQWCPLQSEQLSVRMNRPASQDQGMSAQRTFLTEQHQANQTDSYQRKR